MTVWQILFCLTFVSFLYRSVVPVGYMPDVSAAGDGRFALTFCTTGGSTGIQKLDLLDQSGKASPDEGLNSQSCPFGMVASQALIPAQAAPVLAGAVFHRPLLLAHSSKALPPLPALGPPLGPRAPPSNLG
jgi:hypothetical protein